MHRPIVRADFDFIFHLYMHPLTNPWLLYEPMERADFQPIFDDLLARNIVYVFEVEGQPVGMFKLAPWTHRTDHIAYLGGVAIDPAQSGRGLGKAMMAAILELAKAKGYKRVELSTATTNERAIRLYEQMGFEREGVLRRYSHLKSEGRFLDEVMMSYLL